MKKLIEAFSIFSKYTETEYPTVNELDIFLYVQVLPSLVSIEDKATLSELGFEPDEKEQYFYSFIN